jgi:hypothetical protein
VQRNIGYAYAFAHHGLFISAVGQGRQLGLQVRGVHTDSGQQDADDEGLFHDVKLLLVNVEGIVSGSNVALGFFGTRDFTPEVDKEDVECLGLGGLRGR